MRPTTSAEPTLIPVTDLRVGMRVWEGHYQTYVRTLDPCTQPQKVHVNEKDCYDYCATVVVTF